MQRCEWFCYESKLFADSQGNGCFPTVEIAHLAHNALSYIH